MSGRVQNTGLCLSKNPAVHITCNIGNPHQLQQHEIDGIRFLYKQYKKNKPGVILNDPPGYSHILQTVQFINALHKRLDQPSLVLCNHTRLSDWMENFKKYTINDDLAINVTNPFQRKLVFINQMDRMESFWRRHWGVIVVDNDDFLQHKQLPLKFNAYFKIVITPNDMKKHLEKFTTIFKWLYPLGQFNVDDFRADNRNMRDIVAKSIIFETFVEDIILRRTNILVHPEVHMDSPPVNRVTRKNKDVTGTKIKRSKRKIEDNTVSIDSKVRCENLESSRGSHAGVNFDDVLEHTRDKNSTSVRERKIFSLSNNIKNDDDMDVESFIRSQEPIDDVFRDFVPDFDDNISQCNDEVDSKEEINKYEVSDKDKNECTENIHLYYTEDPSADDDDPAYYLDTQDDSVNISSNDKNENTKSNTVQEKENSNINEIKNELSTNLKTNDNSQSVECDALKAESEKVNRNTKFNTVTEINEILDKVESKSDNLTSDNEVKCSKTSDLDAKLKELEEKALKKFKGSLLDRIF